MCPLQVLRHVLRCLDAKDLALEHYEHMQKLEDGGFEAIRKLYKLRQKIQATYNIGCAGLLQFRLLVPALIYVVHWFLAALPGT